jgi:hypothetical protein
LPPRYSHAGIVANKKRIATTFLDSGFSGILQASFGKYSRFEIVFCKKLHGTLEHSFLMHQGNRTPPRIDAALQGSTSQPVGFFGAEELKDAGFDC